MSATIVYQYLSLITKQFQNDKGYLCVWVKNPDSEKNEEKYYRPQDNLRDLARWVIRQNAAGNNVYASWALLKTRKRDLANMVASAAFVADWDQPTVTPKYLKGLHPSVVVQTSKGRWQHVYIHTPLSEGEANGAYFAMKEELGRADKISSDMVHMWRIPGTMNWPNAKKRETGRLPEMAQRADMTRRVVDISPWIGRARVKPDAGGDWPMDREGKRVGEALKGLIASNQVDDRSKRWNAIVKGLAELGWGVNDILRMLEKKKWAKEKYGNRMEAEVIRCIENAGIPLPKEPDADEGLIWLQPGQQERKLEFLWHPYLPRGEVTLLDGKTAVGKTTLMLRIAHSIMEGARMPNDERIKSGHRVLYISRESDFFGTTLPLLMRSGVEKSFGLFAHDFTPETMLDDDGIEQMEKRLTKHKFDLVVIDNLINYIPQEGTVESINSYGKSSSLFGKLQSMAQRHRCSIVTVRHMAKGAKDSLGDKGLGSVGWVSSARSQLAVVENPDAEGEYVVTHVKGNLAAKGPALAYGFKVVDHRAIIEWMGISDATPEELNAAPGDRRKEEAARKGEVAEWLKGFLKGKGPVDYKIIKDAADARSYSESTLRRAAHAIQIVMDAKYTSGSGRVSTWAFIPGA